MSSRLLYLALGSEKIMHVFIFGILVVFMLALKNIYEITMLSFLRRLE